MARDELGVSCYTPSATNASCCARRKVVQSIPFKPATHRLVNLHGLGNVVLPEHVLVVAASMGARGTSSVKLSGLSRYSRICRHDLRDGLFICTPSGGSGLQGSKRYLKC